MKLISRIATCGLFAAALTAPLTTAAQEAPETVIEQTVTLVLGEISARSTEFEEDAGELYALMEREIVPLFDVQSISRLALGKYWKKANPQQRRDFAKELTKLMIGTYAEAMLQYTGEQTITYSGSEIRERKGRKVAKVSSHLDAGDGSEPVPIEYSMLLSKKDNRWKIVGLKVAGFNIINSYRETYAAAISSKGLDGVIASMRETNAKNF